MKYMLDTDEQEKQTLGRKTTSRGNDPSETEITLGTRSILGIFFGLVLICGVFFGLGYSVGRGSTVRPFADMTASTPSAATPAVKPSAQQSLSPAEPAPQDSAGNAAAPAATDGSNSENSAEASASPAQQSQENQPAQKTVTLPLNSHPAASAAPATASASPPAPPMMKPAAAIAPAPAISTASPTPAPTLERTAAVQPSGSFMVQVAAVRLPQDASILIAALQKHGFTATARQEPQDQLLHIQLGPFATRADAIAMRSRLLASGYNAVLK